MKNEIFGADEIHLAPETTTEEEVETVVASSEETEISNAPELEPEGPAKSVRVNEILELRDANRKVFRMSDGTEQAVFFPETVHVLNKDKNTFDDVDNTITMEEDGRHFVGGKNHLMARFSCEEDNDELFSIESGMHRVTVSAKKNSKQKNKGVKPDVHKMRTEGFEKIDLLTFKDVQGGADYEYCVTGNGVKENIVVKEKAKVYRFPFVLHCENVTAQFDEQNKRIAFVSNETGEEVFFIPAPFMTDANGIISTAVNYEFKTAVNGDAVLTVTADSDWMNIKYRAFPVVIDPQIQLSGSNGMTTYSWDNGYMYSSSLHTIGTVGSYSVNLSYTLASEDSGTTETTPTVCYSPNRMYMNFNMPTLPRNPRIKKAELKFFQSDGISECNEYPKIGLYQVSDEICTGFCTPYNDSNLIDFAKMETGHCEDGEIVSYTFDVTALVDKINKGESYYPRLVLKMIDESYTSNNYVSLFGCNSGTNAPQFVVTYESTYGVNTSYRTHTHEIGRFGQGSIDLQCGNLMFESEDFAWAGNRMPVTIKHLYNSAIAGYQYTANSAIKLLTAGFSAMKIGLGFKLNIMQSVMSATFQHEGTVHSGYVYIGENGEETYFKKSDEQVCCDSNSQCYNLYEDVISGDMLYDPVKFTLKQGSETYLFDASGRLIQITDEFVNHMDITYTSGRITSVTDGAGRDFGFAYNSNGFLTSITAPDNTSILYSYTGNLLTGITYPDGKKAVISYSSDKPAAVTLQDANGNAVYKVEYTFSGDRMYSVTEYGVENGSFVQGNKSSYSYSVASARTVIETTEQADGEDTEDSNIKTVYTFDDDGNVVSEYVYSEDTGNTGVEGEESGIHPHSGENGMGVVSNINNLLIGHNFESLDSWTAMPSNCGDLYFSNYAYEPYAKFGKKVLRMQSYNTDCTENGMYQTTNTLPAGEYTFSAYLRVLSAFSGSVTPGAYIRVTTTDGTVLAESEHLSKYDSEFTRLIAPFTLTSAQSVQVQILLNGRGTVYADAAQLENNPYANAYNMLENGNFERNSCWSLNGASYTSDTRFNMSHSLMMTGNLEANRYASQQVTVKANRSTRETFTLSGWAKGYGLPNHERDGVTTPTFRLRAVVKYYDTSYREYGTETFTADFSPCTEEWQFASVQFSKSKYRTIQYITVYCDYGYNTGTVYFDDIQLTRDSLETYLSASDFVVESTGTSDETAEEQDTTPTFNEAKDKFGNALTETTFTDGEFGTIYKAFGFTPDCNCAENAGNDLVSETDARGYKTEYTVDEDTSRNEEIVDRMGNKTAYEYDASGKTTKVTSKKADNTEIANVSYAYDTFDNMTEIVRGDGMKYALQYNAYHNLESIGIEGMTEKLVKYDYKNGNGRLKAITYANGDTMKATYNGVGQMVAEKWFDKDDNLTAHYKYVYDGKGNIVRSIDISGLKEYNYEYEGDKVVRATECDIVVADNELITSKTLVNTVKYYYDGDGKKTKKVIISANGSTQTIYYENTDEDNVVVKFSAGGKTVTSHSKKDSFGRKVFDELQLGTGFVSRQFSYHAGDVTEEHTENGKLKSSPTTQLVSQIVLSGGRTISYEYDAEERITKVTDSVDGVTEYTYDELGQLLTETVNNETVNTMVYDNYGNIVSKNGVQYEYDAVWKDLLTSYDGQQIVYDAQGNPTSYLGHMLAWEKGRQLKKFDNIEYTYNANGIRTSKIVDGVEHTYTLEGSKILRETWESNTLIPLYDNEDGVCGIFYNDTPYYFNKNLQGDVIAIVDKDATTVAKYSYDAWGVCNIIPVAEDCQIATINPFRYRGYYYDQEIGLYYLQSRYYNPQVGRFVNADHPDYVFAETDDFFANLNEYCLNEPIFRIDLNGFASRYIDNQNDSSWKSVAVGFWGNVRDNGCGAIAIYNVLRSYSSKITINKVLSNLRWMYGSIVYNNLGIIGISPTSVTRYLSSKFWCTYTAGPITYLWGIKAELSGAVIVLYQHKGWNSSLHYVAGIKTGGGSGGRFRFYNDSYYKKKYGTKSISIWKYIDLLKANGCKPLLFWGVAGKFGWW